MVSRRTIWGIADDVLRDVYQRGKYRDVILPMTVIRRLDAVLEPTKNTRTPSRRRCSPDGTAAPESAPSRPSRGVDCGMNLAGALFHS